MTRKNDDPSRRVRSLAETLDEPERHLDFETELAPFAEGKLDAAGREIAQSHIEDCPMCRAEVEDLQRFIAAGMVERRPLRAPTAGGRSGRRSTSTTLGIAASVVVAVTAALLLRSDDPPAVTAVPIPEVRTTIAPNLPPPPPRARYADREWAKLVESTLAKGRLPFVRPFGRDEEDMLRGAPDDEIQGAMTPSGVVVETTRPELRWPPKRGATYVASIYDGARELISSASLTQPRWRPSRDLPRGRTLTWEVAVTEGDDTLYLPFPPAPPARFRILGQREHEELERARREHPDDALLLAALYARNGMEAEARRELSRLSSSDDERVRKIVRDAL